MGESSFMELRPVRALAFETGEDGRVTVIRPKFISPRWAWLTRYFAKPDFRVRLDERGSFLWGLCDGTRSVADLAREMAARFGDSGGDHQERSAVFIHELLKGGFLRGGQDQSEEIRSQ